MADTGQGISVGDAVYHFLADTQNLDQAVDRINREVPAKLEAGAAAMRGVGDAAADAGKEMAVGAQGAKEMGDVMQLSGEKAKFSMYEARGEAALLGEEFGIHLPRHVRSFLAELPGVGEALTAAFSATAALFLVEALIKGSEKLSEWVASTFIFTQAMKDSDASIAQMNKSLVAIKEQSDKATEGLKNFGAAGTDLQRIQISDLEKSIAQSKQTIDTEKQKAEAAKETVVEFRTQYGLISQSWDALKLMFFGTKDHLQALRDNRTEEENRYVIAVKELEAQQKQLELLNRQFEMQEKIEQIQSTKAVNQSALKVQRDLALAAAAFDEDADTQRLIVEQRFQNETYQVERSALVQKLELLKQFGDNTLDAQKKVNQELVQLANNHAASIIESATKTNAELVKAASAYAAAIQAAQKSIADAPPVEIVPPQMVRDILAAEDAAKRLGVTLHGELHSAMEQAGLDFKFLRDNQHELGLTTADVTAAQIRFIAAEIAEAKAAGDTKDHIAQLQAALDKLAGEEPKIKKLGSESHDFAALLDKDMKQGALQVNFFKDEAKQAYGDIAMGVGQAFAAAIAGQESLGQALEKATGQVLEQIGTQAMGWGMYFLAMSLADAWTNPAKASAEAVSGGELLAIGALFAAAGGAIAGSAGGGSGSSSSVGPGSQRGQGNTSGTITQPTQQQGSNTTVQHFGSGGLISRQTLAMLGDSPSGGDASEAALPLDHPKSLSKIVEAFQAAGMTGSDGGNQIHVHVKGMISPDNLTRVVRNINAKVKNNQVTLHASNSQRVTRRSI